MLFETWYQTYFLLYEYYKHVFSQYILNHSFHIILTAQVFKLTAMHNSGLFEIRLFC